MANAAGIAIAIISLIIAAAIVNKVYQLYMKLIGADSMFFSKKTKLIAIFIVWLIVLGTIVKVFKLG